MDNKTDISIIEDFKYKDMFKDFLKNKEKSFFCRINNNKYEEMRLHEGDRVIVETEAAPIKGNLIIIKTENNMYPCIFDEKDNNAGRVWGVITFTIKANFAPY